VVAGAIKAKVAAYENGECDNGALDVATNAIAMLGQLADAVLTLAEEHDHLERTLASRTDHLA
jgi:hypothetical protein